MTSRPPSQLAVSTATRDADRMVRLRVFLKNHDIRYPDIAEQLEPLEGRPLSLQRVHGMLCRNAYMEKTFRDRLLDLGFPEDVLPPEKPVARSPGRGGAVASGRNSRGDEGNVVKGSSRLDQAAAATA